MRKAGQAAGSDRMKSLPGSAINDGSESMMGSVLHEFIRRYFASERQTALLNISLGLVMLAAAAVLRRWFLSEGSGVPAHRRRPSSVRVNVRLSPDAQSAQRFGRFGLQKPFRHGSQITRDGPSRKGGEPFVYRRVLDVWRTDCVRGCTGKHEWTVFIPGWNRDRLGPDSGARHGKRNLLEAKKCTLPR